MGLTNFQVNKQAKESDGYAPFPKNYYPVFVEEVDEKANSKGTGRFVSMKLRVVEGSHKGRIIFDNINYEHENPEVQQAGEDKLSLVLMALGIAGFQSEADVNKICDKFLEAKIETVKKKDKKTKEVEAKDVVWSYRAAQGKHDLQAPTEATTGRPQQRQAYSRNHAPDNSSAMLDDDIPF